MSRKLLPVRSQLKKHWKRYEICSKLTLKTSERRNWRRHGVFSINFEHISRFFSSVYVVNFEYVNVYWVNAVLNVFKVNNQPTVSRKCVVSSTLILCLFNFEHVLERNVAQVIYTKTHMTKKQRKESNQKLTLFNPLNASVALI